MSQEMMHERSRLVLRRTRKNDKISLVPAKSSMYGVKHSQFNSRLEITAGSIFILATLRIFIVCLKPAICEFSAHIRTYIFLTAPAVVLVSPCPFIYYYQCLTSPFLLNTLPFPIESSILGSHLVYEHQLCCFPAYAFV